MENPMNMDDLGVTLFMETPKYHKISSRKWSIVIRDDLQIAGEGSRKAPDS